MAKAEAFVRKLLTPHPAQRPTASAALEHSWLIENRKTKTAHDHTSASSISMMNTESQSQDGYNTVSHLGLQSYRSPPETYNMSKSSSSQRMASEHLLEPKPKLNSIQRPLSSFSRPGPSQECRVSPSTKPFLTHIRSRSERSRHLNALKQMLEIETYDKAKDYGGQMALDVATHSGSKGAVQLPPRKSCKTAKERSHDHFVGNEILNQGQDQNVKITNARVWKGMATEIGLINDIDAMEASRAGLDRIVLEDEDGVAITLPLLPNIMGIAGTEMAVQLLLRNGFDIKYKDFDKEEALYWAATNGYEEVVQLLLERGADIETKNGNGWTPLHLAARVGHKAVAQLLLEKGAGIDTQDSVGWTPLYQAARFGHEGVIQLLLEKGANIETKDSNGWTPLQWAAWCGQEAIVQLLLENGADIEAQDGSRRTALYLAANNGHKAVAQLLKKTQRLVSQRYDLSLC